MQGIDTRHGMRLASALDLREPKYKRCRGEKPGQVTPHLHSVRQWFSSRARWRESITLVTQLSLERQVRMDAGQLKKAVV